MKPGSVVIVHFVQPSEKYWGVLQSLGPEGVTIRGLNVSSFEDWLALVARGDEDQLGLTTLFVPMSRVERMFLDERVGSIPSYSDRFEARTDRTLLDFVAESSDGSGGSDRPSRQRE